MSITQTSLFFDIDDLEFRPVLWTFHYARGGNSSYFFSETVVTAARNFQKTSLKVICDVARAVRTFASGDPDIDLDSIALGAILKMTIGGLKCHLSICFGNINTMILKYFSFLIRFVPKFTYWPYVCKE